jgi:hypothetical protein
MWSLANIAVADGGHRFYAKALYNTGGTPNSNVRLFTAIAAMTPTIASVKDPQNTEIPHNSTTTATTVTLSGKAVNSQRVEIFDGATSKGTAPVSANGDWSKEVTGLSLAAHSFTAKGLYGSNPVSAARTLTVWDLTTFDGRDWNNWQIDPTAEGEFNVRSENNNFYLEYVSVRVNDDYQVLQKVISGLEVGATYQWSLNSAALQTSQLKPILSLMTPSSVIFYPLPDYWGSIVRSFVATSREMLLRFYFQPRGDSSQTHSGFKLDDILIKQIQKSDAVESD